MVSQNLATILSQLQAQGWEPLEVRDIHIRGRSYYRLGDKVFAIFCSRSESSGKSGWEYWFAIPQEAFRELSSRGEVFVFLLCGNVDQVIVLPGQDLAKWLQGVKLDKLGRWHLSIGYVHESPVLRLTGKSPIQVAEFLNKYPVRTGMESASPLGRQVIEQPHMHGIVVPSPVSERSRHAEFVTLFSELGRSLGYNIEPTQAPFRHDVVWRKGRREPFIVIEICDAGSLDKDIASMQWAVAPENWGATGILVLEEKDKDRAQNRLGRSSQVFVLSFDNAANLCKSLRAHWDLIKLLLQP